MLRALLYLAAATGVLWIFPALAQSEKSDEVLRLIVAEDFPPFYYRDGDDFRGISIDVARAVLNRLGYSIHVTQAPSIPVAIADLETGRADLEPNLSATRERMRSAYFTKTPHIHESQDLIIRADTTLNFNGDLKILDDLLVGVISGWTYGPEFDGTEIIQRVFVRDSYQQLRGLLAGNYDVAIHNRESFLFQARELGVGQAFKVVSPSVYHLPVTMAVSKRYSNARELVERLDAEIKRFIDTAEYDQILLDNGFRLATPRVSLP
ncbi:substrate-binding periplasmic protein [Luminiphilus syltensis]|uniref:substrate-binding periplasmic protein n=1 Tax=Luminiphilus syltensis TaxID=1341119 RepID=UPI0018A7F41F|nr:transporter substrate-binding domain-containing protein [Luminiphilus syltensis]